jgi:hypothetical protein
MGAKLKLKEMALDFGALAGIVTEYGTPLYEFHADAGTLAPGEYELSEDGNEVIVAGENGGVIYLKVRTARLDQGIDPSADTLNVGLFRATRDASGEYNGQAWSLEEGKITAFVH